MGETVGLTLALALVSFAGAGDEGFRPLVSGDDPAQFSLVGIGPDAVTIRGGEVRLAGRPNGYFATKAAYRNYVLRFDWMYERPDALKDDDAFRGNSGVLLHVQGRKVWPGCVEVQLFYPDTGHAFAVAPSTFRGRADPEAQRKAARPVGQWNSAEIASRDGTVVVTINGTVVSRGGDARPDRGPIGWQSEGAPVRFRNLRIKPVD